MLLHWSELRQSSIMATPATPPGGRVLHPSVSLPDFFSTPKSESPRRAFRQPMSPGSPSSVDLQQHIYNSLLESRTADICLHVKGTWEAVYKLHRVVLIQSVSASLRTAIVIQAFISTRGSSIHSLLLAFWSRRPVLLVHQ